MVDKQYKARIAQYLEVLRGRSFEAVPFPARWRAVTVPERSGCPREGWSDVSFPFSFGRAWHDTWFATEFTVPGEGEPFLEVEIETDAMVFVDSVPSGAFNPFHTLLNLAPWRGRTIKVELEAWDGHRFPGYHPKEGGRVLTTVSMRKKEYPLVCKEPRLLLRNEASHALYYDVLALSRIAETLDSSSFLCQRLVSGLYDALRLMKVEDGSRSHREEAAAMARKALPTMKNGTLAPLILTSGSAHLDHAWLWTEDETVRKAARTLATMASSCREYPAFHFLFSQPLQMEQVKETYPLVFEEILKAFRRGQFEPNGVGYLEPDCVLSSGEGLIRNLLWGRRATENLFGYRGDTFFVPDSFGFSANLPQILSRSGVKYFVTSKLGWNDTNRFPYDTFLWKGIDGSSVKATMIKGAYEGTNDPVQIAEVWNQVRDKDVQDCLFRTVGEGDGGGGATRDDLALMERIRDVQGFPRNGWTSLSDAMERLFSSVRRLPTYRGELYFERHRGCYTSQAEMKKNYRVLIRKLHEAEYLYCLHDAHGNLGKREGEEWLALLHRSWKTALVCQFHDILPGSCIGEEYDRMGKECRSRISDLEAMVVSLAPEGAFCLNLSPFVQRGIFPYAASRFEEPRPGREAALPWGRVTIGKDGSLSSVIYHGREMVGRDSGWNTLRYGEDYPLNWDAWDIERDDAFALEDVVLPTQGFVRKGNIGESSSIEQKMILHSDCARIDFETTVDWHESHRLLEAVFPLSIQSSRAWFDIPYGIVERSTLENTSLEKAMFEVPAQSFVAESEGDISIALLSDSKYGYHARNNEIGISLLRSPKAPDPACDMGIHTFTYSIFMTEGGMLSVLKEASLLNQPLRSSREEFEPLCKVENAPSVILEWVKPAEDGKGYVLRVRECLGSHANATLLFDACLDAMTLRETDMNEGESREPSFAFHPFEIKTYRIRKK